MKAANVLTVPEPQSREHRLARATVKAGFIDPGLAFACASKRNAGLRWEEFEDWFIAIYEGERQ